MVLSCRLALSEASRAVWSVSSRNVALFARRNSIRCPCASPCQTTRIRSSSTVATRIKTPSKRSKDDKGPSSMYLFVTAGLPLVLFSVGAAWVLKNALEGKTKEMEAYKGTMSKSERQYNLEQEQEEMMDKITKIRKQEFDNTKRIERPDEILERRKKERERRNMWYRRLGRWIMGRD